MRSDHRLAHAHEAGAEAVGADALRGDAGALEQEVQFVGEHVRLAEPGGAAQPDEPLALRDLELLDDAPRRVILFGSSTAALASAQPRSSV